MLDRMSVSHLVEEVVQPQRDFGVELAIEKSGVGDEPICRRNPGILYGLGNLVENAIDFAKAAGPDRHELGRSPYPHHDRGRRPWFPARSAGQARRSVHFHQGTGSTRQIRRGRPGAGPLHRQDTAGAFRSIGGGRQCDAAIDGARIVVSWPRNIFEAKSVDVSKNTDQDHEATAIQAYIQGKPRMNS